MRKHDWQGTAAGTFIYVSCIEMLAVEFANIHTCGTHKTLVLFKTGAVIIGAALFALIAIFVKH